MIIKKIGSIKGDRITRKVTRVEPTDPREIPLMDAFAEVWRYGRTIDLTSSEKVSVRREIELLHKEIWEYTGDPDVLRPLVRYMAYLRFIELWRHGYDLAGILQLLMSIKDERVGAMEVVLSTLCSDMRLSVSDEQIIALLFSYEITEVDQIRQILKAIERVPYERWLQDLMGVIELVKEGLALSEALSLIDPSVAQAV